MLSPETREQEPATALNIVLLPDQQTTEQAIELSQRIATLYGVEFVLDTQQFRPHITLYQGYYPNRNLPKLRSSIADLAKQLGPTEVSLYGSQLVLDTFLFWNCQKTPALQAMHQESFAAANPLREGFIAPNVAALTDLTEEERELIQRTGGILNGVRFLPHITITRLKNPAEGQKAMEIVQKTPPISFPVKGLYIAHLGPHGTISEIVDEFKVG